MKVFLNIVRILVTLIQHANILIIVILINFLFSHYPCTVVLLSLPVSSR